MSLSLHAVKDAALYGLNVAFVQQPKGAIARHAANLARVAYVISALGYAALSFKTAYDTYKANKQPYAANLAARAKHQKAVNERTAAIEQNKGDKNFEKPDKVSAPVLQKTRAVTVPLFRGIGKALIGYGLYAGVKAIHSQYESLKERLGY